MDLLLELLVAVFLLAATAVGATVALRQAPLIAEWDEMGVKPWACDLCMTFWVTGILVAVAVFVPYETRPEVIGAWMPSFALAYTWLTRINPMPEAFPGLPDEPPTAPLSRPDAPDESE